MRRTIKMINEAIDRLEADWMKSGFIDGPFPQCERYRFTKIIQELREIDRKEKKKKEKVRLT